jgi:ABC-2 type transport system permease protein
MKKILLVIQREYLARIRKKSFWILTVLVPILLAALYVIPIYLSIHSKERTNIIVVDETILFGKFRTDDEVRYTHLKDIDEAKAQLQSSEEYAAIVYIPRTETRIPSDAYLYYYAHSPNVVAINNIEAQLERILKNNIMLEVYQISKDDYKMINNAMIHLHAKDLETGRDDFLEVKIALAVVLAVLIYIIISIFGSQVMRGVIEEKNNRIVEVIVSSLNPFQLMMGKIVGIAAVGLTQFLLWIILLLATIGIVNIANPNILAVATSADNSINLPLITQGLLAIDFSVILPIFLLFFILGYLLYASLFAAVGATTDTDSQQFVLPITIPLILSIVLSPLIVAAPSGAVAQWLSMIPFTSPVAMMLRLPFGVPLSQVWLSATILLVSFVMLTWIAARIYRIGILMYGKKTTFKEIWRWITERKN